MIGPGRKSAAQKRREAEMDVKAGTTFHGYAEHNDNRVKITDGQGNAVAHGFVKNCTAVRPGSPGAWISNQRCSYNVTRHDIVFACRGRGEGTATSCHMMTKPAKGLRTRLGLQGPKKRRK